MSSPKQPRTVVGSAAAYGLLAGLLVVSTGAAFSQISIPPAESTRVSASPLLAPGEDLPGGEATSRGSTDVAGAFSQSSGNMGFAKELDFKIGNGLFRKLWVSAPSSTKSSDGLGPLYNARGCQSCHLKDGRGEPPRSSRIEDRSVSMFLRLSIPPETEADAEAISETRQSVVPEPTYGTQLQELAVQGHAGEGRMIVTYMEVPVELAGGEVVHLRRPTYRITDLGYGPLHPRIMISPRMAPQMIGLGLLEAIPEADILAAADPEDRDGDGISGRPNRVWSVEQSGSALGRFGWKAGQPTVMQQSAEAFAGDVGIGSWIVPRAFGECTTAQQVCRNAPHGGTPQTPDEEINRKLLDLVAFYARNLAVPARREPARPRRACRQADFRRYWLRVVPHTLACNRRRLARSAPAPPAHLALHRPAAARHGRGPRPTAVLKAWRMVANGGPRRSGASA